MGKKPELIKLFSFSLIVLTGFALLLGPGCSGSDSGANNKAYLYGGETRQATLSDGSYDTENNIDAFINGVLGFNLLPEKAPTSNTESLSETLTALGFTAENKAFSKVAADAKGFIVKAASSAIKMNAAPEDALLPMLLTGFPNISGDYNEIGSYNPETGECSFTFIFDSCVHDLNSLMDGIVLLDNTTHMEMDGTAKLSFQLDLDKIPVENQPTDPTTAFFTLVGMILPFVEADPQDIQVMLNDLPLDSIHFSYNGNLGLVIAGLITVNLQSESMSINASKNSYNDINIPIDFLGHLEIGWAGIPDKIFSMDGGLTVEMNIDSDDGVEIESNFNELSVFADLEILDLLPVSLTLFGDMQYADKKASLEMVVFDNRDTAEGKRYWFNNYEITLDVSSTASTCEGENNRIVTINVAGRYYHSDYGYVDISTSITPFMIYSQYNGIYPMSGTLEINGAGGKTSLTSSIIDMGTKAKLIPSVSSQRIVGYYVLLDLGRSPFYYNNGDIIPWPLGEFGILIGTVSCENKIPMGPGANDVDWFIGNTAVANPLPVITIPDHPYLSAQGTNGMHSDSYISGTYGWSGPIGDNPQVTSASLGMPGGECATVAVNSSGQLVTVSTDFMGMNLLLMDPDTLETLASYKLPQRASTATMDMEVILHDTSGGAYFHLDNQDRAIIATSDKFIRIFRSVDNGGTFEWQMDDEYDLNPVLPSNALVTDAMPDWPGNIWFVTRSGHVGIVHTNTGQIQTYKININGHEEEIQNAIAIAEDGVYIVTDYALYRFEVNPADGSPVYTWRKSYDRGSALKPGAISQGSGTTPTLFGNNDKLVAITDNADDRINVLVYYRDDVPEGRNRLICKIPVFDPGFSVTENSLIGYDHSLVVENNYNYGFTSPFSKNPLSHPGVTRVDVVNDCTECREIWESREASMTTVPKLSTGNGLIYLYTRSNETTDLVQAWYLTAIDFETGDTIFKIFTGTGMLWNNNWAPITIGPDGTAYIGVLNGIISVRDGVPGEPSQTCLCR